MEKVINLNGSPQELFVIHDPANKITVNVRDATDEQLAKARESAHKAQSQLWESIQNMLAQFQQAAMANSAFTYEIDRRSKSIQVPPRVILS